MSKKFIFFLCWLFTYTAASQAYDFSSIITISNETLNTPPICAINDQDQGVCIWTQSDPISTSSVYASSTIDGGNTWTTPVKISKDGEEAYLNSTHDGAISINDNGIVLVAIEAVTGPQTNIRIVRSLDGGASWAAPVEFAQGQRVSFPQVRVNNNGNGLCVWRYGPINGEFLEYTESSDSGQTWSGPAQVKNTAFQVNEPQLEFNNNDNAVCIWRQLNGGITTIYRSYYSVAKGWDGAPVGIHAPAFATAYSFPSLSFNDSDIALVCFSAAGPAVNRIEIYNSTDAGDTWTGTTGATSGVSKVNYGLINIDNNNQAMCIFGSDVGATPIPQTNYFTNNLDLTFLNWSPATLVDSSGPSPTSQLEFTVNNDGIVIATWLTNSSQDVNINYSLDFGQTWSNTNTFSLLTASNAFPTINSSGETIISVLGSSNIISSAIYGNILTQNYLSKLLLQRDFINKIQWNALAGVQKYRIYEGAPYTNLVYEGITPVFYHHGRDLGATYDYYLTYVDSNGVESSATKITIIMDDNYLE